MANSPLDSTLSPALVSYEGLKTSSAQPTSGRKKGVVRLLKFIFVASLLYYLFKKDFISVSVTSHAFSQWRELLPLFAFLGFNHLFATVRWRWLLGAHDIRLNWGKTLELTFVGIFFNVALPGAVSGDFVKAFYIGREIQGMRAPAFGSILFDRIAGLSALVLVSGGAFIFGYSSFTESHPLNRILPIIIVAMLGVVFFYSYLFLINKKVDYLRIFFQRLTSVHPKLESFSRIYESILHFKQHRWIVSKVLLISIVIHILVGITFFKFAQILGENGLQLQHLFIVVPLGMLITAIPVAPAGVGTGHAAFIFLFNLLGSQRGADVFTLFVFSNIIFSAIGGLIYLRYRGVPVS